MKKVLLVIVDALASRVVEPAMAADRLPTLSRLAEAGVCRWNSISIFPSITPAATASLITGKYPADHGISGAFWYDREQNRVAYYGDDFWVLINKGIGSFIHDYLIELNYNRLKSETLFEQVDAAGMTDAVLNYLWFRGIHEHEVSQPLLFKLMPGVDLEKSIRGPAITALGDFVQPTHPATGQKITASGGLSRRYGFHDATTAEYLLSLSEAGELPELTVAYFPNNDFDSHEQGPNDAVSTLEAVDRALADFLDSRGGLEAALAELAIIITGDHSQSDTLEDASDRKIELSELLEDYRQVPAGKDWEDSDQLMICPNMRAAQIYFSRDSPIGVRQEVAEVLVRDPRVDQVIWRESHEEVEGSDRFCVKTADRGFLRFYRSEAGPESLVDRRDNHWICEGDLSAVDLSTDNQNQLQEGDYPNALERIEGAFHEVTGAIWVTAHVGYELCVAETETHPGGSHGALHALDSTSPLIVAGLPENLSVPENPRSIDVAPLVRQILDLSVE